MIKVIKVKYLKGYLQLITTVNDKEQALEIARRLVKQGLTACAQVIGPITSAYRWRGIIEVSTEWLCFIKSKEEIYEEVERIIKEIHPCEVPEIIALPIKKGTRLLGVVRWGSKKG